MKISTTNLVLPPDAAIDLQLHTTYSDGIWLPEQLIDYLVSEGFGLVAITDHDRVDTVPALQQLALEKHLPMLVAVEMSASWQGGMTDVLCFGFDANPNALRELAQNVLRNNRKIPVKSMRICSEKAIRFLNTRTLYPRFWKNPVHSNQVNWSNS